MKLFALAGLASASTQEWIMNQWYTEATNVYNFAKTNWGTFQQVVDSVDDNKWTPLWKFCNINEDMEITPTELMECGQKTADFFEMPKGTYISISGRYRVFKT